MAEFWDQVNLSGDCWLWTGRVNSGYGRYQRDRITRYAHVVSYETFNGPIPLGYEVDHRCGVRLCVRPDHLRAVTRKQNMENTGSYRNSKTGIRGVHQLPNGKWRARVVHNRRSVHGGVFDTVEDADHAARELRATLFTHSDREAV